MNDFFKIMFFSILVITTALGVQFEKSKKNVVSDNRNQLPNPISDTIDRERKCLVQEECSNLTCPPHRFPECIDYYCECVIRRRI
ncbi:unnamed protein product [Lactuca virosa]|uniref:Uncharacterized protein n=1 Tax=Lactuca virosa TaxID=75947 RepID=A0AAU9PPT8_9ASTR|nr:unnamed protein product [Lactuca virosa]